ncbi:hypothetical protein [Streptomyces sp. CAU 1734]|uniref:hypothetical protein n=1 Tax=Streptomyces sp. CAU 1734 TaxID=3140360 RepID=UPI003261360D
MGRTGTTRRRALMVTGVIAAGTLSGCAGGSSARVSGSPAARASADAELRKRLATASGTLRDRYDATLALHPGLAERLSPMRASVTEHITALGGPPGNAPPVPLPPPVPADETAALASLAAAERHTADTHTAALDDAGPELARLLASLAAAGAAHVYLLGGAR